MHVPRSIAVLALMLACSCAGQAEVKKSGTMTGSPAMTETPLPEKNTNALLFVSRDVSNLSASVAFYTQVLGLKEVGRFDYADGTTHEVFLAFSENPGGVKIVLQYKERPGGDPLPPTDGLNRIVFQVADIVRARGDAVRYGGTVSGEVYTVNNVSMGAIADPDGHRIMLIQQK